jgi:cytoskeletal protein CcmA (bactofilin family)
MANFWRSILHKPSISPSTPPTTDVSSDGSQEQEQPQHTRYSRIALLDADTLAIENAQVTSTNLAAENIHVLGSVYISGLVNCESLQLSPVIHGLDQVTLGGVQAARITGKGSGNISHTLKAREHVRFDGKLSVGEDLECERLEMNGVLLVDGIITAQDVEMALHSGTSRIDRIEAKNIRVRKAVEDSEGSYFGSEGFLMVDEIFGEDIYLENCSAKFINCKSIRFGVNCQVHALEFSERVDMEYDTQIQHLVDLNSPYVN